MNDIIPKLRLIKDAVNNALDAAQRTKIEGAINWGDLSCTEVKYCINDDGSESYEAIIEEAAPENYELRKFITGYMLTQSKVSIDHELIILTEW